jgi:hypothetical protein
LRTEDVKLSEWPNLVASSAASMEKNSEPCAAGDEVAVDGVAPYSASLLT